MLISDKIHLLLSDHLSQEEASRFLQSLTVERLDLAIVDKVVDAIRRQMIFSLAIDGSDVLDCSGTGGSGLPHFNTSTAVAFVVAAAGVKVAKFGNRAASGRSGSFDLLEQLGFPSRILPLSQEKIFDQSGLVFLFAPQFYPCLAKLAPIRKALGTRTILNFIGPLLNPVRPAYRLLGVSARPMQKLIAQVLAGSPEHKRALVVCSADGQDELATNCSTDLMEVTGAKFTTREFIPYSVSAPLPCFHLSAEQSSRMFRDIVSGRDVKSFVYRAVCLNAGAALYIAGKAPSIEGGIAVAQQLLREGAVQHKFKECRRAYVKYSQ